MYDTFLASNRLTTEYLDSARKWFTPCVEMIVKHTNSASPLFVSINGSQGSGKSTLADYLTTTLTQVHQLKVINISIDDFYYDHDHRQTLAEDVHPLLATRGVPGTHNIEQLRQVMDALSLGHPCIIPSFDKATDNPKPVEQWQHVNQKVDVVIVEGWCMQIPPQLSDMLTPSINQLEQQEDENGVWRRYVNIALQHYQELFQRFHLSFMLKAPSFSVVQQWREEQESKLRAITSKHEQQRLLTPAGVSRFIAHYERLTKHALAVLPAITDMVFILDEQRQVQQIDTHKVNINVTPNSLGPLIFTDLDGTLLDHDSYSSRLAYPALAYCQMLEIPVIPTTSKTFAELLPIRSALNLDGPFIVENGAAVYIPKKLGMQFTPALEDKGYYWCYSMAPKRAKWIEIIQRLSTDFAGEFTHFSAMKTPEIVTATGLTYPQAQLAKQREYGEPVLWLSTEQRKIEFIEAAILMGASPIEGGRFIHINGSSDKATAMQWLHQQYEQHFNNKRFVTVALGDGPNDTTMLNNATYAAQIRSPAHDFPLLTRNEKQAAYQSKLPGPAGWNEYITTQLLSIQKDIFYG